MAWQDRKRKAADEKYVVREIREGCVLLRVVALVRSLRTTFPGWHLKQGPHLEHYAVPTRRRRDLPSLPRALAPWPEVRRRLAKSFDQKSRGRGPHKLLIVCAPCPHASALAKPYSGPWPSQIAPIVTWPVADTLSL